MVRFRDHLLVTTLVVFGSSIAGAVNPVDTQTYLKEFHKDPARVMNERLPRVDEHGKLVNSQAPLASELQKSNGLTSSSTSLETLLNYKDQIREEICQAAGTDCLPQSDLFPPRSDKPVTFAGFGETDKVENFLDQTQIIRNLKKMEDMNLTRVALKVSPWSDSFWPTSKGMIARRYHSDAGFPNSGKWNENFAYFEGRPPWATPSHALSPAEKYDLLVGDNAWRMTHANWNKGKFYFQKYGFVPGWVGLCHGWAPAAIVYKQPLKPITVTGVDGHNIDFYPSDIKALASMLWGSKAAPSMKIYGQRCKTTNPPQDEIGRVIDDKCFNTNPGTWHIAIVNQMGVSQRSFVMDSTWDFEVWNYPVYSFHYSYFNPQTLAVSDRLATSLIPMSDYKIDKFKKHRAKEAKYVVGIAMEVAYANPTMPSPGRSRKASHHTVKYVYDLELDANFKIIGGEWYSNHHPDFIWTPSPGSKALARGEKSVDPTLWDGTGPLPREWAAVARGASGSAQPLNAIVDALVKRSRQLEQ